MGTGMHVLAQLGHHTMAVDVAWVREARHVAALLPAPPRHANPVAGLLPTRHGSVPVLSLDRWISDLPPPAPEAQLHVLVLAQAGRCVGLRVDALLGLRSIDSRCVQRLHHEDDPSELFDGVARHDDMAQPIALLEPGRLMALARTWASIDDSMLGPPSVANPSDAEDRASIGTAADCWARVRVGQRQVALRSAQVCEVIPLPKLQLGWSLAGRTCGLASWRGRAVAVLRPDALGIETDPTQASRLGVVLRSDDGSLLMLPADELLGLTQRALDWQACSPSDESAWLAQALLPEGDTVHALDVDALMKALPESRLGAGSSEDTERPDPTGLVCARNDHAFLVVEAAHQCVIPISEVRAVLDQAGKVGDLVQWRHRSLPVRSVLPATVSGALLLVTGDEEDAFAQPIQRLVAIVPARTATLGRLPGDASGRRKMLSLDQPLASYPVVSLAADRACH